MEGLVFRSAFLSGIVSLAVIVYGFWLATRFVSAIEKIAERMDRRGP
jgi:hypothetical protein